MSGHFAAAVLRERAAQLRPQLANLPRVPGGLAMSVTLMGTIMAATTGIVRASVVMLTLVALPAMMQRGYQKEPSAPSPRPGRWAS